MRFGVKCKLPLIGFVKQLYVSEGMWQLDRSCYNKHCTVAEGVWSAGQMVVAQW